MKYPLLFSSFKVGPLNLKNRLVMVPLFLGYANSEGTISEMLLQHYRDMAAGGVSMVVTENVVVDSEYSGTRGTLRADKDDYLPGLTELARAIKENGALACCQINHQGRYAQVTAPVSASAVPASMDDPIPRPMEHKQIQDTIKAFAAAALRVKKAGFDAVEIHGGYLLAQFLSPHTNKRNDEYGGSLENRMRFPMMVVQAVKEALGRNYPVGYRFLADEWLPDGFLPTESLRYALILERIGINYLSVTAGTYESFFLPEKVDLAYQPGYMVELAGIVKQQVKIPVIVAGRINTPELAEEILTQKKADLIGLARVLFIDPQWIEKATVEPAEKIKHCPPDCYICMETVTNMEPVICPLWQPERKKRLLELLSRRVS
jgi:2,4-dienoyl-CoA reductase-like NADH-dependent reductase (Old Yellow Enzyme family)